VTRSAGWWSTRRARRSRRQGRRDAERRAWSPVVRGDSYRRGVSAQERGRSGLSFAALRRRLGIVKSEQALTEPEDVDVDPTAPWRHGMAVLV